MSKSEKKVEKLDDFQKAFKAKIDSLTKTEKLVLDLHFYEGKSKVNIARILNCPICHINNILAEINKKLI